MLHLYRQHGICLYLSPGIRSRENILSLVEKLFSGFKKLFSCLENILSSFENKFSRHENNFFSAEKECFVIGKKRFFWFGKGSYKLLCVELCSLSQNGGVDLLSVPYLLTVNVSTFNMPTEGSSF